MQKKKEYRLETIANLKFKKSEAFHKASSARMNKQLYIYTATSEMTLTIFIFPRLHLSAAHFLETLSKHSDFKSNFRTVKKKIKKKESK